MDPVLARLVLTRLPGLTPEAAAELRRRGEPAELLARPERHSDLLPADALSRLRNGAAQREAERERPRLVGLGAAIVLLGDAGYPERLRHISDPPPLLFVRGRWPPPPLPPVAIVGARAATPGGCARARDMAAGLARSGVAIVSGLARGIDAAAHRGALDAGSWTAAVLGTGLDQTYPAEHAALAEEVAGQGALISEFPLGTSPRPGHFPRRNRVIAGLCVGVVVVEATHRSGALVTAGRALDFGREVMAVPGAPGHPLAAGTNALIRDGARLVRDAADVAEELRLPEPKESPAVGLLGALRHPVSLDELVARSGRPAAELLRELTELEVAARVRRLPGAMFVRA
jgi:DNA processing protein